MLTTVLWSRSNLNRFRLPAPDNNIFVTQVQVKSAVLKTKVNNLGVFFKCTVFFFQFVYKL